MLMVVMLAIILMLLDIRTTELYLFLLLVHAVYPFCWIISNPRLKTFAAKQMFYKN